MTDGRLPGYQNYKETEEKMSSDRYSKYIARSVDHIFKTFLNDAAIKEVFESQSSKTAHKVMIEIGGTLTGELIINFPPKTLNLLTSQFINSKNPRTIRKNHKDVAGELANLITGTFANQLQYIDHNICVSTPEFDDDPISIKTLYENINLSFSSSYGGFDVDLYYKED
jgi:CheY-specific phosphatase CheX